MFIGLLTDPFIAGRGDGLVVPRCHALRRNGPTTDEHAVAYTPDGKRRTKAERDAYAAMYKKAMAPGTRSGRCSAGASGQAGFGGSQTTAAMRRSDRTPRPAGSLAAAAGADYRFSPFTPRRVRAGGRRHQFFGLANGLGGGHSDLFQAGAFVRHTVGPAYISAAMAYGWQHVTTDRTVASPASTSCARASTSNALTERLEGGYRFPTAWMGITPYAAGQFTTIRLPAYAEQVVGGGNAFALSYAAKDVTVSRSELGLRSDKSFAVQEHAADAARPCGLGARFWHRPQHCRDLPGAAGGFVRGQWRGTGP